MRHGDKIKNLSRTASHRKALLCNLTCQLIEHKRIFTTLAKARSLRVFAEPLITRCKTDNMHNRRIVFSYLQDKEAIKELFGNISDKVADRPGGYTRIIKMPRRIGDASDMAMIELVDFNEIYGRETEEKAAKKTRRSRRSSGAGKKQGAEVETATTSNDLAPIEAQEEVAFEEATTEADVEPMAESNDEPMVETAENPTDANEAGKTEAEAENTSTEPQA
jgi:large subunit ribosomal protein L17